MVIEIRIYRRHDADLMMLKAYGVNIPKLIRSVLENYVEGKKIKYSLPGSMECSVADMSMFRCRVNVQNQKAVNLIRNGIKHGYRNQFCKMLVRDALETETLGVYFNSDADIQYEDARIKEGSFTLVPLNTKKDKEETQKELHEKVLRKASDSSRKKNSDAGESATKKPEISGTQTILKEAIEEPSEDQSPVPAPVNEQESQDIVQQHFAGIPTDRFAEEPVEAASLVENSYDGDGYGYEEDDYDDDPFGAISPRSEEEIAAEKAKKSKAMLSMFNDIMSGVD